MSELENYEDIYPGCRPPYGPELTQTAAEKARKTVPFVVRAAMPADTAALDTLFRASYGALLAQDYAPGVLARALPALFHTSPRLLSAESFFRGRSGRRRDHRGGGLVPGDTVWRRRAAGDRAYSAVRCASRAHAPGHWLSALWPCPGPC